MKSVSTSFGRAALSLSLAAGLVATVAPSPASAARSASRVPAAVAAASHWEGPATTPTPMSAADAAALQKTVDDTVAANGGNIPGLWVGVWHPEKGWAIASAGNAVVGGAPAVPADHNRIGSATKTFVATEVLKVVDAKKLALSDTIGTLLPALAKKYPYVRNVTVQQMLGMRSGLPDYTEIPSVMQTAWDHPQKVYAARTLIRKALSSATATGKPKYSNTNYLLLGEIAKKVTGKPIWTLVNANVTRLGLTQTRLPAPGKKAMPAPASKGYNFLWGQLSMAAQGLNVDLGSEQRDDVTSWGQAAGAMYSTVADLGRWGATGLGLKELSPALAAKRLASKPINDGAIDYGLGMEDFGNGWIGHDGQAIGWEARVAYNTTTGAVAVVMINDTGALFKALAALKPYFPELAG
jgi:D-alanyl-D-alanine carboxypeptidase